MTIMEYMSKTAEHLRAVDDVELHRIETFHKAHLDLVSRERRRRAAAAVGMEGAEHNPLIDFGGEG